MILSWMRVAYRVPMALVWTLAVHYYLMTRKAIRRRKWGNRRATDMIGLWGKGLNLIMGVRVKRLNERSGPLGDVVFANHMGFLDVAVLLSVFPAVFIIKGEMRRAPYFGRALERQGHIFVKRTDRRSSMEAAKAARAVIENGDRLIVFPEGKAAPGLERPPFKSFCFKEAARQGKSVEVCVLDYLPDRKMLEWDISKPMLPQVIKLLGRHRTHVSIEFLPTEIPDDGDEAALRYHDLVSSRLAQYDANKAG
jgi:1-acyl-sn-glycerol-3-phosphate acyltransferase